MRGTTWREHQETPDQQASEWRAERGKWAPSSMVGWNGWTRRGVGRGSESGRVGVDSWRSRLESRVVLLHTTIWPRLPEVNGRGEHRGTWVMRPAGEVVTEVGSSQL